MKQVIDYDSLGNDLFAQFKCECPSEKYKDDPVMASIMKTTIKLTGYNDNYFFNVVNKEPRELYCGCGRDYKYQWTHAGVIVEKSTKMGGHQ